MEPQPDTFGVALVNTLWNIGSGVVGALIAIGVFLVRGGARAARLDEQIKANNQAIADLKADFLAWDGRFQHQINNIQSSLSALSSALAASALRNRQ